VISPALLFLLSIALTILSLLCFQMKFCFFLRVHNCHLKFSINKPYLFKELNQRTSLIVLLSQPETVPHIQSKNVFFFICLFTCAYIVWGGQYEKGIRN
jgi:hypothetical protein